MADARTPEHGLTHFTVSDAVAAEYVAVHPTTRIVDLYLSTDNGEQGWPLNDSGWWCSQRWCQNWSSCKGAALTQHALVGIR